MFNVSRDAHLLYRIKVVGIKEFLTNKKFGRIGSLTLLSASIIAWRSYNHVWWL
jgi:hypothetical protein